MPCSVCKGTGHNKVTCPKNKAELICNTKAYSTVQTVVNKQNLRDSKIILNSDGAQKLRLQSPKKKNESSSTKKDDTPKTLVNKNPKDRENPQPKIQQENLQINLTEKPIKPHRQVKIVKGGESKSEKNSTSNPCGVLKLTSDKIISLNLKPDKKGAINNPENDIESTLVVYVSKAKPKNASNSWEMVKINEADRDVLTAKGIKRFHQGPSADDGPGYIYMYKQQNSEASDENNSMFKIGCSNQLPERRVHTQELRNKETYNIIISREVAYRKLTELLIHLGLKEKGMHYIRKVKDGGTEWFRGKREELIEDINVIIRFLNIYAPSIKTS